MKCPACDGEGGYYEDILGYGQCSSSGPYYDCDYCNGEGETSIWKCFLFYIDQCERLQKLRWNFVKLKMKVRELWNKL